MTDELVIDDRLHCCNGWGPSDRYPSCNYTGGHFCERLAGHKGKCRCVCGSTTTRKPPEEPTT